MSAPQTGSAGPCVMWNARIATVLTTRLQGYTNWEATLQVAYWQMCGALPYLMAWGAQLPFTVWSNPLPMSISCASNVIPRGVLPEQAQTWQQSSIQTILPIMPLRRREKTNLEISIPRFHTPLSGLGDRTAQFSAMIATRARAPAVRTDRTAPGFCGKMKQEWVRPMSSAIIATAGMCTGTWTYRSPPIGITAATPTRESDNTPTFLGRGAPIRGEFGA